MKKLLFLTAALTLISFTSAAIADDTTVCLKKAGETKTKVSMFSNDKEIAVAPIMFASDASWDSVKDSYDVSPDVVSGLESKKLSISVAGDGTLSFSKKK